jgi:hypothetical protein
MYDSYSYEFNYCSTLWFAGFIYRKNVGNFSLRLIPRKTIGEKHPLKPHLSCFLCFPAIDPNNIGHVHSAYNPYFSACFFKPEQCFSFTTNQPTVFFSRLISTAERGHILTKLLYFSFLCFSHFMFFLFLYFFNPTFKREP